MELMKKFNEFLGEDEAPKFREFTDQEIYQMIDFWQREINRITAELNSVLNEIDIEEQDYIKGVLRQYDERKNRTISEYGKKLDDLKRLLNALYKRLEKHEGI